ncbi:MAG: DinB family protein [Dehalococcoidia bacterium]|nr:DinB family protein [Dehalococcoidia bacterium]
MTQQTIPAKAELLEALRSSGQQATARLRALAPAVFEQGRYENGWNARQILAHIASIEWTYPRLLDLARNPPGAAAPASPSALRASPPLSGGINDYNERQVAKRADAGVEELIAEFEKNRAATIAAVEAADEALLRVPVRSAGGITGPLATVIHAIAVVHVQGHVGDIAG